MRPSSNMLRTLALAALLAALAGCSEYLDRRDTISLGGGDAVATDKVTQMVDPWPRASADNNIAFNGDEDGNRRRTLSHQPRDPAAGHRHVGQLPAGLEHSEQYGAGRTDA